ncbi:MAG: hypothetical protein WBA17_01570 [Saprospiraceae bacterium]
MRRSTSVGRRVFVTVHSTLRLPATNHLTPSLVFTSMRQLPSSLALLCLLAVSFLPRIARAQAEQLPPLAPTEAWEARQNWQDIPSLAGRFTVTAPGEFREKVDTIETAVGQLVYHTLYLVVSADTSDNSVYMLSYTDYPEGSLHEDSTETVTELLDVSRDAAVETVRGELRFDTEVAKQGHPGRYWRIDYLNGRAGVRTQAFVVGRRYYAIQTVSRYATGINPSTERFFRSLRFYD